MNVHDVRKMCLHMTLCVQACSFIEFYVLILDEIYLTDYKLIEDRIWVGKVQEIIPKDHPSVLEEGPKMMQKTVSPT